MILVMGRGTWNSADVEPSAARTLEQEVSISYSLGSSNLCSLLPSKLPELFA